MEFAVETAFVMTWTAPLPGRLKKGLQLIVGLEKFWDHQAVQGDCTRPDVFLLPNGPGAVTVYGKRQVLEKLATSEGLRVLLAMGQLLFQDWLCRFVDAGSELEDLGLLGCLTNPSPEPRPGSPDSPTHAYYWQQTGWCQAAGGQQ
jgi:hypothetical protein